MNINPNVVKVCAILDKNPTLKNNVMHNTEIYDICVECTTKFQNVWAIQLNEVSDHNASRLFYLLNQAKRLYQDDIDKSFNEMITTLSNTCKEI